MVTGAGSGPNQTVWALGYQSLVWKDVSLKNIGFKFHIFSDARTYVTDAIMQRLIKKKKAYNEGMWIQELIDKIPVFAWPPLLSWC